MTNALPQVSVARVPELGRLKHASERIACASAKIDSFLYRFNGPRNSETGECAPQPPDSYRNDIDGLFSQIDTLEGLAAALDEIG